MAKLKDKRRERFCQEYAKLLNATEAATVAGFSAHTAKQQGSRQLSRIDVAERIQELAEAASHRNEISLDRVLEEFRRVAFFDLREAVLWGPGGVVLRDCEELCPEHAAAIESVSQTDKGLKIKAHSKPEALKALLGHLAPLAINLKLPPRIQIEWGLAGPDKGGNGDARRRMVIESDEGGG